MSGEGGPLAARGTMPFAGHKSCAEERWCRECRQLRHDACAYPLCDLALTGGLKGERVVDDRPVAVVRWTEDGELQLGMFGEGLRMLVVDERATHDRVYEITHREPLKALERLVPSDSEIGSAEDDRHEALVARMTALFEGRPHLTAVRNGE